MRFGSCFSSMASLYTLLLTYYSQITIENISSGCVCLHCSNQEEMDNLIVAPLWVGEPKL